MDNLLLNMKSSSQIVLTWCRRCPVSYSSNDTLIQLIKDLSNNSQDDTDPNNVVVQQFQSPYEEFKYGEDIFITKWQLSYSWAGEDINSNFCWNQGGQYAQKMEVFKCLMLL